MEPKPAKLSARLKACIKDGRLSVADLQVWFGKSRCAVLNWIIEDRSPRKEYCEEVFRRLKLLEMLIRKKKGTLVPYRIGSKDRPDYIRQLYNENDNAKLFKRGSTE